MSCRCLIVLRSGILLSLAWTAWSAPLGAADASVVSRQVRNYTIAVDGIKRGFLTSTISRHADGSETMSGEADIRLNFIVYRYRYSSTGKEVWKEGKLVELANEADYNGEKFVVTASAVEDAVHVSVNGEDRKTPGDVWVTSYWREPHASKVGRELRLFDSDKGRLLTGKLHRVGDVEVSVDEKSIPATHYRLRGDVEVDLWYDREGRLARQESLESGHRTLLELSELPE
jgi:hypothetical protein